MSSLIHRYSARDQLWRTATVPTARGVSLPVAGRWQCDLATSGLWWSPAVFALFGIEAGSKVDRRATVEMYDGESRKLMEQLRASALDNCGSFTMEAQIRGGDGAMRWMRLSADVACRGGKATHLYGTKQDITLEMAG